MARAKRCSYCKVLMPVTKLVRGTGKGLWWCRDEHSCQQRVHSKATGKAA